MVRCETCGKFRCREDIVHPETDICFDCHEKWVEQQYKYWYPLYLGEKRAGLLDREEVI